MSRTYFVYILTNKQKSVLYIGVTNNLERRNAEHLLKTQKGFTERYNAHFLVYFESTTDIYSALEREEQLKRWSRNKKEWLIETMNPNWTDMSEGF